MKESWRAIVGYEDKYEVSNIGRVRGITRTVQTKRGVRVYQGKLITGGNHSAGYKVVNLSYAGHVVQVYVHRLVADAFIREPKPGEQVNHKDLNKANNTLDNLEYVTRSENIRHALTNGVKVGRTKLSQEDRIEIRNLRLNGSTVVSIAKKYKVLISAIYEVLKKETWSWE